MRIDSPIMTNTKATGSFSGSFFGAITAESFNSPGLGIVSGSGQISISLTDGYSTFSSSLASDIASNTAAIAALNDTYTTDAELNASSSALISGYQLADSALSSSLATAITSEYGTADTNLSSSLAADIAVNTAKVGYTDTLVKTKLNAENVISGSTFSSPSQGTVRATINGVNTDIDTGLQVGDSPTFTNLVLTGNLTVEGSRTELQVTELNVEDKNITIASGAADSAAADGAGITIAGANESITWNHANSRFNISDDLNIEGNITLTGTVDGVDIAQLSTDVSNLNNTFATDAELNASSSALITGYGNADSALSSSLATAITSEYQTADTNLSSSLASALTSEYQTADTNLSSSLATAITSEYQTADTNLSSSLALGISTNAGNIATNAGHISALHSFTASLNNTFATDAELNASSSALITAYGNADSALSSSLASALTGEYQTGDTNLSSSLASAISAIDTAVPAITSNGTVPSLNTGIDAGEIRTLIDVDQAGTDNSTDVTLEGSYDYITIVGQTITRNQITNDDLAGSIANAKLTNSSITINGSAVSLGGTRTLVTDDIAEDGSPVNLWYTDARVKTKLNAEGVISSSAQIDHDATTNFVANEHIDHTSVSITAGSGLTGGGTIAASRTFNVGQGDGISVSADAVAVDSTVARRNAANTFSSDQTFTNIFVNGTGSFAYIQSVTGSAKIIGDAYIILNADAPSERYSGIKVIDSGSAGATGSLEYDSVANHWFYESTSEGYSSIIMSGPKATRGSLTVPTSGSLVVAAGNHLYTSQIKNLNNRVDISTSTYVTGSISATGDIIAYASSDERLKDNIKPITDALDKVEKIRGVSFNWNDKQNTYEGHDIGVIAQEIEAVLPELVQTRDNGYKAVKYEKLTAVLIQAVKELSGRVKELESK